MLKKIIISRGRSESISTHRLLNDFIIVCPESEAELYKKVDPRVETIPDKIVGLAAVRNWIMDNYKEDILFIDDDISCFTSVCGIRAKKINDKEAVDQILDNLYSNAKEAGARVFGLNQSTSDARKYNPHQPFLMKGWVGTVIGVIGKELKFDERNKIRVDVDFCLQSLMHDRFIWVDNRFSFTCARNTNLGGNAMVRSEERLKKEKDYLKRKWGKHIIIGKVKKTDSVRVNVEREERIIF